MKNTPTALAADVNVVNLAPLPGDDVDLSMSLNPSPVVVKVDEGSWRKLGVSEATIEMVKKVGLVKNLLF